MLEVISVDTGAGLSDEAFSALSCLVSPEKNERLSKSRHRRGAVNSLIGEIIARNLICVHTGIANKELSILTDRHGKPHPANTPDVHFNISHSKDLVVCAISDRPVGVDIEIVRAHKPAVAKRFFHEDEQQFMTTASDGSDKGFFMIWTMKESFVKWQGKGLSKTLDSFNVFEIVQQGKPIFHYVDVRPNACCHICSDSSDVDQNKHYTLDEYIRELHINQNI